jgi:2'-5' RNA ligase
MEDSHKKVSERISERSSDASRGDFERLLIALSIPHPTSSALACLQEELPGFRWSNPENLHLTLRYIGEVDAPLKAAICAKLQEISVEPFILPVENIGVFPVRGQPQVVYAGLSGAHPRLFQLQRRVEEALMSLGIPLELRAFAPHITLARVSRATPQCVNQFTKKLREYSAPPFRAEAFCLFKSRPTHFGFEYTRLQEFPLKYKVIQAKAG